MSVVRVPSGHVTSFVMRAQANLALECAGRLFQADAGTDHVGAELRAYAEERIKAADEQDREAARCPVCGRDRPVP